MPKPLLGLRSLHDQMLLRCLMQEGVEVAGEGSRRFDLEGVFGRSPQNDLGLCIKRSRARAFGKPGQTQIEGAAGCQDRRRADTCNREAELPVAHVDQRVWHSAQYADDPAAERISLAVRAEDQPLGRSKPE